MDQSRTIFANFGPEVHTLQIVLVGKGSGTVIVNPPENTCDADCSQEYNGGTQVTLTADPDEISSFAGWSGVPGVPGCSADGSDDTCTVTMDQSRTIFANFGEIHTLQIELSGSGSGTVSSAPIGISCGEDCDEYLNGTEVTLTPTPAEGSVFSGWSGGGCSGTGQCTVIMDRNHTVTATFGPEPPTLQVVLAGTGSGTVSSTPAGINCGEDCTEIFPLGTQVTLMATPTAGSVFSGWDVEGCGDTGPCTITMDQRRSVTATFTIGNHTVSNIQLSPASPALLTFNQNVNITFNYSTNETGGVQIFFRPFTEGDLTPNYAAHGSPVYPVGDGSGTGFFTITTGTVDVDSVRVQILNADQSVLLNELFIPVDYSFVSVIIE
jgi:hypothetical protein